MKVVLLMPVLMLPNNRKANMDALNFAIKHYGLDIVVCAQEFTDSDYADGVNYIKRYQQRQGFVIPRNDLLRWFYNSDYDYAVWMDGNGRISKPALNDFVSVVEGLRTGAIDNDVILSTRGIIISADRIQAKKNLMYKDFVLLKPVVKKSVEWMHGLIMRNFKKKYGVEVYIDERCDPKKGTSEDIYFVRLLKRLFDVRLAPTVTVSKPSNTTSTWMQNAAGYTYTKFDGRSFDDRSIDNYVDENVCRIKKFKCSTYAKYDKVKRVEQFRELVKPYSPRTRKKKRGLI